MFQRNSVIAQENGSNFEDLISKINDFTEEVQVLYQATPHDEILSEILLNTQRINFFHIAFPDYEKLEREQKLLEQDPLSEESIIKIKAIEKKLSKMKLHPKHFLVITIAETINLIKKKQWSICLNNGLVYLYNNAYWKPIDKEGLQKLFGEIAEKLGVPEFDARFYQFREGLLKQFYAVAHLPRPKRGRDNLLMNFLNGTLEIMPDRQVLRKPAPSDFLTYQLPFPFDASATAPLWLKFLNEVLPDKALQNILAEYLASTFVSNRTLKLEKVLMTVGSGSNGKGVVYEVTTALFGAENVSNFSLESLTDEQGYYRAKIANKLLNYSSENSSKVDANFFKQLASGEDVPARNPYGEPFQISDYAKLIFNTNKLPKEGVEQTHAFFRRFLIIPFEVTIAEEKADKELHLKIIANELPGVFNWVMEGLRRLLLQKGFTISETSNRQVEEYKIQSDSVRSFLFDESWEKSTQHKISMSEIYEKYKPYCLRNGLRQVSIKEFSTRFREAGYETKRESSGTIGFAKQRLDM